MTDEVSEELKQKVLEFFKQKKKMLTSRDVATGLALDHATAKKVCSELVKTGALEFTSFGGATFIKLPEG
jgi:predicted transcriptional regulator of viral defense system